MKKGIVVSIGLIILGFVFEYIYFATDITIFEFKSWLLGVICMTLGMLGILYYAIVPFLEKRAERLGKHKKGSLKNKLPK